MNARSVPPGRRPSAVGVGEIKEERSPLVGVHRINFTEKTLETQARSYTSLTVQWHGGDVESLQVPMDNFKVY